jgi:exosortase K
LENGFSLALAATIGFALKYHYSRATAAGLSWVLSPTASMVNLLTGISLESEQAIGFISRKNAIALVPACAGVNFMIAAFFLLCISIVFRVKGTGQKLIGIAISAAVAYLAAIMVNAVRIASILMFKSSTFAGWATEDGLHRIGGTLIYFIFLLLIYPAGCRIAEGLAGRLPGPAASHAPNSGRYAVVWGGLVPLLCYLAIAIGIPLSNGAWHQNAPKFIEHCTQVISVCLVLLSAYFSVILVYRRLSKKIGCGLR